MTSLRVGCLAALLGVSLWSAAQSKPTGGGGTGATGGSAPTNTPVIRTNPTPSPTPQRDMRPFFISGKVILDDGSQPTARINIQRICGVSTHRESSTDSRGNFSFQINPSQPEIQDAGDIQGPMIGGGSPNDPSQGLISSMGAPAQSDLASALQMCDIRASLPGYVSDRVSLAGKTMDRIIDVGTIVLHPIGQVSGSTISITTMKAPKAARKLVESGRKKGEKEKFPEALQDFQKAVQIDPNYAEAWYFLGEVQQHLNNESEAAKDFQQSLAADSKYVRPYLALAQIAVLHQDWAQVADVTDKLLALDAVDYPVALYYNSAAYYNLHVNDRAEKSALRALRLDSQHKIPKVNLLMAEILYQRHDFSGAADQIRTFLKYVPDGPDAASAKANLDKLTKMGAVNPSGAPAPQQQ